MIETHRLKNVIFIQTILSFVLSRKILYIYIYIYAYLSKWKTERNFEERGYVRNQLDIICSVARLYFLHSVLFLIVFGSLSKT